MVVRCVVLLLIFFSQKKEECNVLSEAYGWAGCWIYACYLVVTMEFELWYKHIKYAQVLIHYNKTMIQCCDYSNILEWIKPFLVVHIITTYLPIISQVYKGHTWNSLAQKALSHSIILIFCEPNTLFTMHIGLPIYIHVCICIHSMAIEFCSILSRCSVNTINSRFCV